MIADSLIGQIGEPPQPLPQVPCGGIQKKPMIFSNIFQATPSFNALLSFHVNNKFYIVCRRGFILTDIKAYK